MDLESLDNTVWDVLISGTGLRESLLAASLAKSGKKVLHIDAYSYYGREYAALSLDELEAWANDGRGRALSAVFEIHNTSGGVELSKSRAYTINLAPGLLYTTSPILSLLVDNNLHESLEFLKVGSWFVYDADRGGSLMLVPSSREDVFNDRSMDARTKRVIVRALKSIIGLEDSSASNGSTEGRSLRDHLAGPPLSLPPKIISAFTSLTLLQSCPAEIEFKIAEEKIRRHFGAMGRFGPGFSAVIGRYGSGSELVQLLCRAAAVSGNAVYVLENGIAEIKPNTAKSDMRNVDGSEQPTKESDDQGFQVQLRSGDKIWARHIVGIASEIPLDFDLKSQHSISESDHHDWQSLYIVSSSLEKLFQTNEPPVAAGSVIYFPSGCLTLDSLTNSQPIYIFGHSSETGECPQGQCVLYVSMKGGDPGADKFLDLAVTSLLQQAPNEGGSSGEILMSTKYKIPIGLTSPEKREEGPGNLHVTPDHYPGIEIPDDIVTKTLDLYEAITGSRDGFMEKAETIEPTQSMESNDVEAN